MSWIEGGQFSVRLNGSRLCRSLGDLRKLFQLFRLPPRRTEDLEGQSAPHRPIYTVVAKNEWQFHSGNGTGGWAPGQQRALPHWVNSGTPQPTTSTPGFYSRSGGPGLSPRPQVERGWGAPLNCLRRPGGQWRSRLCARAIGQSLVTWLYLAVKDAGKCSLAVCLASVVIRWGRREFGGQRAVSAR